VGTSIFAGDVGGDEPVDQVSSGADVYSASCASCHGADGEGGEGPALNDPRALQAYRTASRLHAFVRLSMPYDAPGSLSQSEYFDVIAFLLDWHGLNPEGVVIDAESVDELSLVD
jgi:cytochrome c